MPSSLRFLPTRDAWPVHLAMPHAPVQREHVLHARERRGEGALTPREREMITQIVAGLDNREIARVMAIAPGTVKIHVRHLMKKLECRNRTAVAMYWVRLQLANSREDALTPSDRFLRDLVRPISEVSHAQ